MQVCALDIWIGSGNPISASSHWFSEGSGLGTEFMGHHRTCVPHMVALSNPRNY